jgi:hypothetical protein
MRTSGALRWLTRRIPSGCLVASVAAVCICGNAVWSAPPRFDGAGYALLARALLQAEGYRATDHPDRPRHAHFPPGYPLVLAAVWTLTRVSVPAAHIASTLFTIGACLASWVWFRRLLPAPAALALGLALAVNWLWARTGSAIQSEPLYALFSQLTILAAIRATRHASSSLGDTLALGVLLAASLLTRQVAVALALAILVDLALRARWAQALAVAAVTSLLVAPWVGWMIAARSRAGTQLGLLVQGELSLAVRVAQQSIKYLQRIPDQITGPFVEVATEFRSEATLAVLANLWATMAASVIGAGWFRLLRRRRGRLAGLVPLLTLGVLVLWPYTEAGRLLIPLIPFVLIGAVVGIAGATRGFLRLIGALIGLSRARTFASCLVLAASIPYSGYMLAMGRARMRDVSQRDFDAACRWLVERADRPGPVLSRHPGDVYWNAGRQGLEVASAERPGDVDAPSDAITTTLATYRVAYILVDQERYANAPPGPLARFVAERPERVRKVWQRGSVSIYEVIPASSGVLKH